MKKLIALILAVATLASVGAVASAASETVLTTTVPAATYTLNIPANQEIPFGATETKIGNLTITEASGFAEGKDLKVTIAYDAFKASDIATTIPFVLDPSFDSDSNGGDGVKYPSGSVATFYGKEDGSVNELAKIDKMSGASVRGLYILVDSTDWGKALGGEYSATITFTAEVVVDTTA